MGESERTYAVGILTKDEKIKEALVEEFEGEKNVAIIDLVGMGNESAKTFIDNVNADIIVTDEDSFTDTESREIIDDKIKKSGDTYFVTAYNDENAARMYDINELFLKNEVPVFPSKIGFDGGYGMLAGNVRAAINVKINNKRRAERVISELSERVRNG